MPRLTRSVAEEIWRSTARGFEHSGRKQLNISALDSSSKPFSDKPYRDEDGHQPIQELVHVIAALPTTEYSDEESIHKLFNLVQCLIRYQGHYNWEVKAFFNRFIQQIGGAWGQASCYLPFRTCEMLSRLGCLNLTNFICILNRKTSYTQFADDNLAEFIRQLAIQDETHFHEKLPAYLAAVISEEDSLDSRRYQDEGNLKDIVAKFGEDLAENKEVKKKEARPFIETTTATNLGSDTPLSIDTTDENLTMPRLTKEIAQAFVQKMQLSFHRNSNRLVYDSLDSLINKLPLQEAEDPKNYIEALLPLLTYLLGNTSVVAGEFSRRATPYFPSAFCKFLKDYNSLNEENLTLLLYGTQEDSKTKLTLIGFNADIDHHLTRIFRSLAGTSKTTKNPVIKAEDAPTSIPIFLAEIQKEISGPEKVQKLGILKECLEVLEKNKVLTEENYKFILSFCGSNPCAHLSKIPQKLQGFKKGSLDKFLTTLKEDPKAKEESERNKPQIPLSSSTLRNFDKKKEENSLTPRRSAELLTQDLKPSAESTNPLPLETLNPLPVSNGDSADLQKQQSGVLEDAEKVDALTIILDSPQGSNIIEPTNQEKKLKSPIEEESNFLEKNSSDKTELSEKAGTQKEEFVGIPGLEDIPKDQKPLDKKPLDASSDKDKLDPIPPADAKLSLDHQADDPIYSSEPNSNDSSVSVRSEASPVSLQEELQPLQSEKVKGLEGSGSPTDPPLVLKNESNLSGPGDFTNLNSPKTDPIAEFPKIPALEITADTKLKQGKIENLQREAESGNADAQYELGEDYYFGREGLRVNHKETARLHILAANQGHREAQYSAGIFYEFGRDGVEQNMEEAAGLYKLAAEKGHLQAQGRLEGILKSRENRSTTPTATSEIKASSSSPIQRQNSHSSDSKSKPKPLYKQYPKSFFFGGLSLVIGTTTLGISWAKLSSHKDAESLKIIFEALDAVGKLLIKDVGKLNAGVIAGGSTDVCVLLLAILLVVINKHSSKKDNQAEVQRPAAKTK